MWIGNIKHLISKAQKGDELSREKLINKHRDFIAKVSSVTCGRFLTWENDDELSIALIAFNESIDAFDTKENIKFTSFAQTVIKRRLIDYFRSQGKYKNEVLASPTKDKDYDELEYGINSQSISNYNDAVTEENLASLVEHYKMQLAEYSIDINELPKVSPKHRDTRKSLMNAAQTLVESEEMANHLRKYGQLPIKQLCQETGLKRKVLERGRKYIISLAIILIEPSLSPLKSFSNFPADN